VQVAGGDVDVDLEVFNFEQRVHKKNA